MLHETTGRPGRTHPRELYQSGCSIRRREDAVEEDVKEEASDNSGIQDVCCSRAQQKSSYVCQPRTKYYVIRTCSCNLNRSVTHSADQ